MAGENTIQYSSTGIILDSCKIEYEREMQRTSNIDGKTNTFLTISTALYAFFIPLANLNQLFSLENNLKNTVSIVFLLGLIIISFVYLYILIQREKHCHHYLLKQFYRLYV